MKNKISLIAIVNIFSIVLFLVFISYVYFDINNIFKTLKEIEREKIVSYTKAKSMILSPLIYFKFFDETKEEMKKIISNNSSIKYIKLIADGFVYEKGNKEGLRIVDIPVFYKKSQIANIVVGYDNELVKDFSNKYFKKLVVYLLMGVIIFLILYFYLREKIDSLNKLAKKIEVVNFKKVKNLPLLDKYYEIVNITNSLNKLLFQINKFYIKQQELIKKIVLYKKQLETAQRLAEMFTFSYCCNNNKFDTQNFEVAKNWGFEDIDKFIASIENRELFLNRLKEICKYSGEFEKEIKVYSGKDVYYFKVMAKNNKNQLIGTFINITEEVKQQEKIEFLAYHDPLTGLINRRFLKERLKSLMNYSLKNNNKLAVVFMDLDNFKMVNDSFGHEAGDILLIEISNRLKKGVREKDVIARIGGDEFVIVLNGFKDKTEVVSILDRLKESFSLPIRINEHKLYISFSMGVSIFPQDSDSLEELLQYADIAMYDAKKKGKNRYSFISKELQKEVQDFYLLVDDLKKALTQDEELVLYFQPKMDIVKNKIIGMEALIRWQHPKKGLLTPYSFINIAEKANLIHLIDSYVLKKAVEHIKSWELDSELRGLSISINISATKFKEKTFISEIENLINTYKIDPSKLQIEITETLSMQNLRRTLEVLEKIKSLGIKIALDDFGTGYSSLSYLKKIPFDILKIDQVFVKDLLKDEDDFKITQMIVEIGKILNKTLVAEGVENREILEEIEKLGVNIVQGYYFAKPMSENDLKTFIANFDERNYK